MILKWQVNALCSYRRNISVWTISRHAIILKILGHSRMWRNTRSGMARGFARHVSHRERLEYIMKKENGNQMMRIKEEIWKRVCEALYSIAPNVLKELYNSMPRRIADLIKVKRGTTKYWTNDVGVQVSCCVFIRKYLKYDAVFSMKWVCYLNTNVVWLYVDMIYESKMAWHGKTPTINV